MKRIKAMFVDDEEKFLGQVKLTLESDGDIDVITESDSRQAADRLKDPMRWPDGYPDIFFLDIVMPGLGGGGLASIIHEQEHLKGIPIVFFTASDRVITRDEVAQAGGCIGGEPVLTKGNLGYDRLRHEILKRTGHLKDPLL